MNNQEGSRPILDVETTSFTGSTSDSSRSLALTEDLERATLQVRLATVARDIENQRTAIIAEEELQRETSDEISRVVEPLRHEVAELAAEIERLSVRLERLEYAELPFSDRELDDQDHEARSEAAAFWAEWQFERDEQARRYNGHYRRNGGNRRRLKKLYRQLARLIHPDLAADATDLAGREVAMRLANIAYEAGDEDQLHRMVELWSVPDSSSVALTFKALEQLLEQRKTELAELEEQYRTLVRSSVARLARASAAQRRRTISRQQDELRREIAALRLKRRRLLRTVEARRRKIAEVTEQV